MARKKKGAGSFCIPREAVEILLRTEGKSKWLIPSYLKIAAHTDASGIYSTASHSSIRKALKRNKHDAQGFIQGLCDLELIYTAEQWTDETGEIFSDDVPERQKIRHIVNIFDEDQQDMIWFNRSLVDGIGEFIEPLRRLADCGNEGARMFLYFYGQYDAHSFHACNPHTTSYRKYIPDSGEWATNYMIKEWQQKEIFLADQVLSNVFPFKKSWDCLKDPEQWEDRGSQWDAVYNLESAGFIYEMAIVVSSPIKPKRFDGEIIYDSGEPERYVETEWDYVDMDNMAVVYELANLDRFAVDTGELHKDIKHAVDQMSDHAKSSSVYSIMPTGSNNSVIGLFKPRFIPNNKRNAFVSEAIDNQESDRNQAINWIKHFKKIKKLKNIGEEQSTTKH